MRLRTAFILSSALTILLLGGFGCSGPSADVTARTQPITLTYWRVFDDSDAFSDIIDAYHKLHPYVTIDYRKLTYAEYDKALLNGLAEDKGPDLFSLQAGSMHDWQPRLLPAPATLSIPYLEEQGTIQKQTVEVIHTTAGETPKQVANDFIDTVASDVVMPVEQADPRAPMVQKVYGLPLSVDTMVLYYNRDVLNNAGISQPATDWKAFQDQVKKLTRLDQAGTILQSGAAIGTADNVERAPDVLALLMMQNGAHMTADDGTVTFDKNPAELASRPLPPGAEALVFYTDFANPVKEVYTWNAKMPDSLQAFAAGQTAFFFGYAYDLPQIRQLNPKLNFGISPFPQISGNVPVNYANYWVEVASAKTAHPNEAWDFLQFATKAEQAQKYLNATHKPTALRSLVNAQLQDLDLSTFAAQLPTARTWYHGLDVGATESAFLDMIRQMATVGADPRKLVELAAAKVNQTIR